jgi:hypothetical protein
MPAAKKRTTAKSDDVLPASSQNKKLKANPAIEVEECSKKAGSPPSQQISDSISLKSPFRSGPHASLAAADATLSCLDSLSKGYEKKAKELVYLARNKSSTDKEVKKGIANVVKLHKKESVEILAPEVDVSSYNHGFYAGILAYARLTGGIIHASEEAQFVETTGALPTAAVMRQLAIDCFPDLHV